MILLHQMRCTTTAATTDDTILCTCPCSYRKVFSYGAPLYLHFRRLEIGCSFKQTFKTRRF